MAAARASGSFAPAALASAAFAIGTAEFVVMGLLPDIAADLHVSIPRAGLLITAYALGVVIGGPLVAMTTTRLPRKVLLLGLIGVFVAGNVLCALAPRYGVLVAARVLASLAHGTFFGVATLAAGQFAGRDREARAIATVFAGLTVSNVLGVPLGTLIGHAGGWRMTFWVVAGLAMAAFLLLAALVPAVASPLIDVRAQLRTLARPRLWLALGMTAFGFGGVFMVFTYIAPILATRAGYGSGAITAILVVLGVGATVGTLLGGVLADRARLPSVAGQLALLAAVFVGFAWAMSAPWLAVGGVFLIALLGFGIGPALQAHAAECARDAPLLAATLNQSAFNAGNAGGAALGAGLLACTSSYGTLAIGAAAVTSIGLLLTAATLRGAAGEATTG